MIGTTVLAVGTWVPERNWDPWRGVGRGPNRQPPGLGPGSAVRTSGAPTIQPSGCQPMPWGSLPGTSSAPKGDGLYSNLIERLKD
jgi:hypothetical protein